MRHLSYPPPDDLGPLIASDSKSSVSEEEAPDDLVGDSDNENNDDPLQDDLEEFAVEESFSGIQFNRLLPTAYSFDSFHVGLLTRYADHDKDEWYWAVISNVADVSEDGSFDIDFRLCVKVDPSNNGIRVRFPDGFYELLIDRISFQHEVTNIKDLAVGDHVRFLKPSSSEWYMGWITTTNRNSMLVKITCERDRNMIKRFLHLSITGIVRVPMIPDDIIESEYGGEIP